MARFKDYSYDQTTMVAISFDRQILPGSFEYTLSEIIDTLDMSLFENRYHNDATGAPEDKVSSRRRTKQSNITVNESA
jgi:hypothetical protein